MTGFSSACRIIGEIKSYVSPLCQCTIYKEDLLCSSLFSYETFAQLWAGCSWKKGVWAYLLILSTAE